MCMRSQHTINLNNLNTDTCITNHVAATSSRHLQVHGLGHHYHAQQLLLGALTMESADGQERCTKVALLQSSCLRVVCLRSSGASS